ncbi:MAG: glutathione S-transferase N-terminal domain-containing protein [Caulobacterales bacterium]
MKLYQSIGPNPRVTTMFIAEKGISLERRFIDILAGDNRRPPFTDINPYGKTPVLSLDDASHLTESAVIRQHLDERFPEPAQLGSPCRMACPSSALGWTGAPRAPAPRSAPTHKMACDSTIMDPV